jgi:hypothetical protein
MLNDLDQLTNERFEARVQTMNSLRNQGWAPMPWRWLEVGVVLDRVTAWRLLRAQWENERGAWAPGGAHQVDLEGLERLLQAWPHGQMSVTYGGEVLTLEALKQDISLGRREKAKATTLPATPEGPCWSVLTPQGPILLQAMETWPSHWDGGLVAAHLVVWDQVASRPSLLQVLQVEPLEEVQVKSWAPWASLAGDLYVIP